MNDIVFQAALAGLLHDVGKFGQRAAEGVSRTWDKEAEKEYKYKHALYSGDFVEQFVPKEWRKNLSGPAWHHKPQSHHDRVVALADHLSAGERAEDTGKHPKQLLSIFCDIAGLSENRQPIAAPEKKYLPLKILKVKQDTLFPGSEAAEAEINRAYQDLWDEFKRQAETLKTVFEGKTTDPESYLNNIANLMQLYTWCIPSAYYKSRPDVSLYDHSRMTAALAACLITRDEVEIEAMLNHQANQTEVALLVGGDISGVQKFIYTITSRGATSGLRGRSMYLQLLTEVTARYVLKQLGLPLTNLIYAGGGHFYLLAPIGSEKALQDAQRQISRILLHHHQGDLYLALASETLRADEFQGKPFSEKWRSLTQKLQLAKQTQFAELGDDAKLLFEPLEHGGNDEKQCAVCQREHAETKEIDGVKKCPV
jgi:CRISPR-associated protein Csm1